MDKYLKLCKWILEQDIMTKKELLRFEDMYGEDSSSLNAELYIRTGYLIPEYIKASNLLS